MHIMKANEIEVNPHVGKVMAGHSLIWLPDRCRYQVIGALQLPFRPHCLLEYLVYLLKQIGNQRT